MYNEPCDQIIYEWINAPFSFTAQKNVENNKITITCFKTSVHPFFLYIPFLWYMIMTT